jgi:rhomboid protease GluP
VKTASSARDPFFCAAYNRRLELVSSNTQQSMPSRRAPIVTLAVVALTATSTALQFVFPGLLRILERRPGALAAHEYWRLITPIFFHPAGWQQIVVDFAALMILGAILEHIVGGGRWLVLYFAAGVAGEFAGFAWKPLGAGSSVAVCGLLGGLAAWLLRNRRSVPSRFGGLVILTGALVLTTQHDLHGPPLLVGVVLGWVIIHSNTRKPRVPRTPNDPMRAKRPVRAGPGQDC